MLTFFKKAIFNHNLIRLVFINWGWVLNEIIFIYLNAILKIAPYDTL